MRACVLLFLVLGGCASSKVITLVGPKADFEHYLTYRIQHPPYPEDSVASTASLMRKKIDRIVQTHFDNRGYTQANPADLVISYKLILENKVDVDVNDPYRNRYNPGAYTYADRYRTYPYVVERSYTEGTLLVEIREDYGKGVVWDGSLDLKYNKSKTNKDPVANAFQLVLSQYRYVAGQAEPEPVTE